MKTCLECSHINPDDFTSCGRCNTPLPLATDTLLQGRLRAYRIIQVLGHGGFGITYLAEEQPTGERVVVKELKMEAAIKPKARELFEREARTLARLDPGRGMPDIKEFFAEGDRGYLVMEFIEGESLAEVIARQGALPEDRVLEIALKLLGILDYIHGQEVIHRDIKPENMMMRKDGSLVLLDFGAVKEAATVLLRPGKKPTSSIIYTAGYAPPEQMRGMSVNQTADLYASAATLIHLLTGQHPASLIDPQTGDYHWQHLVSVSPQLAEAINKATAYRPMDRYQMAAEMRAALKPKVRGGPKVPAWVWAGLGAIGLIGAVIVIFVFGRESGPGSDAATATALAWLQATQTAEAVTVEPTSTAMATVTSTPTAKPRPPTATPTRTPTPTPKPPTPTRTPRATLTPTPTTTPVPASAILYSKDFEDGVADDWKVYVGNWSVDEDKDGNHFWRGTGPENYPQAWLNVDYTDWTNWTNYAFESRIRFIKGTVFICARADEGGAFYTAYIDSNGDWVSFAAYDGSEFNSFGGTNHSIHTGEWYTVRFEIDGDRLRLYINDRLVTATQRSARDQGGVGYYMGGEEEIHFDDIRIWVLTP